MCVRERERERERAIDSERPAAGPRKRVMVVSMVVEGWDGQWERRIGGRRSE